MDALAHSAACSSRHAPASGSRLHPQEVPRGARTSASASSLDCSGSVMHRSNTPAAALLTAGARSVSSVKYFQNICKWDLVLFIS